MLANLGVRGSNATGTNRCPFSFLVVRITAKRQPQGTPGETKFKNDNECLSPLKYLRRNWPVSLTQPRLHAFLGVLGGGCVIGTAPPPRVQAQGADPLRN